MGLLNKIVAGLGNPGLIGIDLICKRARFMCALISKHFFNICFTNLVICLISHRLWSPLSTTVPWVHGPLSFCSC